MSNNAELLYSKLMKDRLLQLRLMRIAEQASAHNMNDTTKCFLKLAMDAGVVISLEEIIAFVRETGGMHIEEFEKAEGM